MDRVAGKQKISLLGNAIGARAGFPATIFSYSVSLVINTSDRFTLHTRSFTAFPPNALTNTASPLNDLNILSRSCGTAAVYPGHTGKNDKGAVLTLTVAVELR